MQVRCEGGAPIKWKGDFPSELETCIQFGDIEIGIGKTFHPAMFDKYQRVKQPVNYRYSL